MNKLTRKMLTSIITLVLTVVALTTTTFAWFSLGDVSTVSGIDAEIMTGAGIDVRLHWDNGDGVSYNSGYKAHLDDEEWGLFFTQIKTLNAGQAFKFAPVTTQDAIAFTEMVQTDRGHLKLSDTLAHADGANKKYLEFNLSFRSLSAGTVVLNELNFEDGEQLWNPTDLVAYEQGIAGGPSSHGILSSAENAIRVAFLQENELMEYKTGKAVFENDEVAYAEDGGNVSGNTVGQTTGIVAGQYDYLTTSRKMKLYESNGTTEITDPTAKTIVKANEIKNINDEDDGEGLVITLAAEAGNTGYYVATVTVRIWVEGWDADAYDSVYGRTLELDMLFNKVEA